MECSDGNLKCEDMCKLVRVSVTSIPETWSRKMPRIWKCGMAQQHISANSQWEGNEIMINWQIHANGHITFF